LGQLRQRVTQVDDLVEPGLEQIVLTAVPTLLRPGSVVHLKQRLDADGFRLPVRIDGAGRSTEGGPISRGHVYRILSNPIYVGRISHKGQVHEGQHPPIVSQDMWDKVRLLLRQLGYEKLMLYDGSMGEWATDASLPIETD
jgi:hypothetical protein